MIERTRLGATALEITRIGFGAWAIGGSGWEFSWGPQDDSESIAAIRRAVDHGVNWIDTAAAYGLGHSEEIVRRALVELDDSERPYVFTKCERVWDAQGRLGYNLKRESIRRECEASLRRLGVERIDLYQVHWPRPGEDLEEGWAAMDELRREGKIRFAGASNFSVEDLERALAVAPVDVLQPRYSLVNPDADDAILPFCEQRGIGVIVYSPMGSGLLTGAMSRERVANLPHDDHRRRRPEFQELELTRNLEIAERVKEIAARHGRSPGMAAVAWTLANPAVDGAIVGFRRPAQIDDILAGSDLRLELHEVEELSALARAAPC